jgi:uncharacterized membrane protein
MNDAGYRKRLAADLPKWLDAGWVTADNGAAILASIGTGRRATFGVAAILGTLGALLLGLGVLAFVGANWEEMPRLVRLGLIVLAMIVAYGAAFEFDRRDLRIFAEAGVLAAALVYAGAIALVGQTYHMSGDFAGAILLFEVGVLGAALFTGSPTLTVVALVAAGYWAWLATFDNHVVPHWESLAAILVGIFVATVQSSHYGRIVAVLAFMYWAAMTIFGFATNLDWTFAGGMMVFATAALAIWSFGAAVATFNRLPRFDALGEAVLWPGLFAILVSVGALQLVEHPSIGEQETLYAALALGGVAVVLTGLAWLRKGLNLIDLVAVVAIGAGSIAFAMHVPNVELWAQVAGGVIVVVASLWAVSLGQSGRHPIGKTIGLVAFGVEVIYLYIRTFGTLLDTAFAFLLGGVLFIALSFLLYRVDRMLARRATIPPSESTAADTVAAAVPAMAAVAMPPPEPPPLAPELPPAPMPPSADDEGDGDAGDRS